MSIPEDMKTQKRAQIKGWMHPCDAQYTKQKCDLKYSDRQSNVPNAVSRSGSQGFFFDAT